MAHDVFISYSAKDKPIADAVCATLESKRIRCWIAPRDILPGKSWPESIAQAIASCRIMILIYSVEFCSSKQVKREINLAIDENVIIVPFRIGEPPLEGEFKYFLKNLHWLEAINPPTEDQIGELVMSVSKLMSPKSHCGSNPADSPEPVIVAQPEPKPVEQPEPELISPPKPEPLMKYNKLLKLVIGTTILVFIMVGLFVEYNQDNPPHPKDAIEVNTQENSDTADVRTQIIENPLFTFKYPSGWTSRASAEVRENYSLWIKQRCGHGTFKAFIINDNLSSIFISDHPLTQALNPTEYTNDKIKRLREMGYTPSEPVFTSLDGKDAFITEYDLTLGGQTRHVCELNITNGYNGYDITYLAYPPVFEKDKSAFDMVASTIRFK